MSHDYHGADLVILICIRGIVDPMHDIDISILGDNFVRFRYVSVLFTNLIKTPECIIRNIETLVEAAFKWIEEVHLENRFHHLTYVIYSEVGYSL